MSSSQNLPSIHCLRIYIFWYFSIKSSENGTEDSFTSTIRLELFLSYKTKLLQHILLISGDFWWKKNVDNPSTVFVSPRLTYQVS